MDILAQAADLESENRELRLALMQCVTHGCSYNEDETLDDCGSATLEGVLELLEELGLAEKLAGRLWRLRWPEARR